MSSVSERLGSHVRVLIVDDERTIGNGVIVILRQGWTFEPSIDNRVRGEDTLSAALQMVRRDAFKFDGPYTQ